MCREKLSTSKTRVSDLEQQVTDLEAARAAGEAAVQEHLAMREKQTDRIRKAKAGGLKGKSHPPPPILCPWNPHPLGHFTLPPCLLYLPLYMRLHFSVVMLFSSMKRATILDA